MRGPRETKTPEGTPGVLCSAGRLSRRAAASASAEPAINDYFCRAKLLPPRHASPRVRVDQARATPGAFNRSEQQSEVGFVALAFGVDHHAPVVQGQLSSLRAAVGPVTNLQSRIVSGELLLLVDLEV
jgi:hypothetical protein